jgi:phage terminase large subunit
MSKMTKPAVNKAEISGKKKATGRPFVKGDPRINRRGRLVSDMSALKKEYQKVWSEIMFVEAMDENGRPILDKKTGKPKMVPAIDEVTGEKLTRLTARLRVSTSSRNTQEFQTALAYAYGKPTEEKIAADIGVPISLSLPADLIAPDFVNLYRDIRAGNNVEYALDGGRGSTKSTFVAFIIPMMIVNNPTMHALVLRRRLNTIRNSVYDQLKWTIGQLGLDDKFRCTVSPMEIEYIPTGQKIYFRGADDPANIKSIKPPFGYIGLLWFEEFDQFEGEAGIRNIVQSALRGGDKAYRFETWNTPKSTNHWLTKYMAIPKPGRYHHHSTYLNVPHEWLGQVFLDEAEYLKSVNPTAYDHEYLGIANGLGGQVFENVVLRKITDAEIAQFDHVGQGLDWGYFPDPLAWGKSHYDAARHKLFVFDEYKAQKKSNRAVYDELVMKKGLTPDQLIIADSAELKSIADFREYGASCRGAEKGPESVNYSTKWMQSLVEIVIDPERCPEHAQEFIAYELEQDKDGNYISEYPDKNNHFIDAERYRTNLIWRKRGQ